MSKTNDARRLKNEANFINRSKERWGERYDYSNLGYVKGEEKCTITCKAHGIEFVQVANSHMRGIQGCEKCREEEKELKKASRVSGRNVEEKTASFVKQASLLLEDFDNYDYSESVYSTANTAITIICKQHGPFTQRPDNHLKGIVSCMHCRAEQQEKRTGEIVVHDNESFVRKATQVHGSRYDYSLAEFVDYETHVVIRCREHGNFKQSPRQHLIKQAGCVSCGRINRKTA